ncbi:hypothetical protein A3850_008255 [Lewinella sp. 4G2]|nr:hypothetical protein A3850_008255 [Lewinella sp. 4G2]
MLVFITIFASTTFVCGQHSSDELLKVVANEIVGNNLWPYDKNKDTTIIRYVDFHLVSEDSASVSVILSVVDLSLSPRIQIITKPNLTISKRVLPAGSIARLLVPLVIRQNGNWSTAQWNSEPITITAEEQSKIIQSSSLGYEVTEPIILGDTGSHY